MFHELFAKQPRRGRRHEHGLPLNPAQAEAASVRRRRVGLRDAARVYDAIEEIALDELEARRLSQPDRDHLVRADARRLFLVGMPLMYPHWSFGKRFAREEALYRKGYQALAYEIVINSNPCISYCMEENTMTMQTLVIAHAAFGHNHFFKNNYLFQQWTDADGILDYLDFAKRYVAACEERHGHDAVEAMLDAAHALMDQGVFRYRRAAKLNLREYERAARERRERRDAEDYNELWRTVARGRAPQPHRRSRARTRRASASAAAACPRRTCSISSRRTARC